MFTSNTEYDHNKIYYNDVINYLLNIKYKYIISIIEDFIIGVTNTGRYMIIPM